MTHYNRSNPFLYILDRSNDNLIMDSHDTIKHMIILACLSLCWFVSVIVSSIACKQMNYQDLIEIIGVLMINVYCVISIRVAVLTNKTYLINKKKYPDSEFVYTYFNNEELFEHTLKINHHIGKLSMLRNQITLFWGLILLNIISRIIVIIIKLI